MDEKMDAQVWDEMYQESDQRWSGEPNGALVTEVTGMPPGQALDVGCGEGGDARWLAGLGWQVTAIDVSRVALERATAHSTGVSGVAWTQADLTVTPPPAEAFDLVSAQYFPLPHQENHAAVRGLLAAVAPGGTFLFVSHDLADMLAHDPSEHHHRFDPTRYYQPAEIATLLDDTWIVEVNETRPRTAAAPPGTDHVHDTVLRARRR